MDPLAVGGLVLELAADGSLGLNKGQKWGHAGRRPSHDPAVFDGLMLVHRWLSQASPSAANSGVGRSNSTWADGELVEAPDDDPDDDVGGGDDVND